MGVKVKICGITNLQDAEAAIDLGADALGFNFWPRSKRFVDIRREAEWIRLLPDSLLKVAVTVNPSEQEAKEIFALPFIDLVQFHGEEEGSFCAKFAGLHKPFIKAIAVRDSSSCAQVDRFRTENILLDAYAPGAFGGTGKTIDWDLAAQFVQDHPELKIFLSGGLTPENLQVAIQKVKPFAVDVASGVEEKPGKKDLGLMRAFITAAKTAVTE